MLDVDDEPSISEIMLEVFARAVGGLEALQRLDDEPLPAEAFDWTGIPDDVHESVGEVLLICDEASVALFDVEHRTAARRLLADIVRGNPDVFRRRAKAVNGASSVLWIVANANESFGSWSGGLLVRDLAQHLGVGAATPASRASTFLLAIGVDPYHRFGAMDLGSPRYLVRGAGRELITLRNRYSTRPGEDD